MQACGHMYLDEGEELSTGTAKDNLLSFSAFTAAGGSGGNSTTGQVSVRYSRTAMTLSGQKMARNGLSSFLDSCQRHAAPAWVDLD